MSSIGLAVDLSLSLQPVVHRPIYRKSALLCDGVGRLADAFLADRARRGRRVGAASAACQHGRQQCGLTQLHECVPHVLTLALGFDLDLV